MRSPGTLLALHDPPTILPDAPADLPLAPSASTAVAATAAPQPSQPLLHVPQTVPESVILHDANLLMLDGWDDTPAEHPVCVDPNMPDDTEAALWGTHQGPSAEGLAPVATADAMHVHSGMQELALFDIPAPAEEASAAEEAHAAVVEEAHADVPEDSSPAQPSRAHLAAFDAALEREGALVAGSHPPGAPQQDLQALHVPVTHAGVCFFALPIQLARVVPAWPWPACVAFMKH